MKKTLSIFLVSIILFGCSNSNNKTQDSKKENFINSKIELTKSQTPLPIKVEIGTWEDIINENNESIVFIYQTTLEDYKFLSSKDSLISHTKSTKVGRDIINDFVEMDVNFISRYYVNDSLLGTIKIEPEDWD
jgi:hypothetical protein